MSLPRTLSAYADIAPILDAALTAAGARYIPPCSPTYWRMRAHTYRSLCQQAGITAYDNLVITVDGQTLIIEPRKTAGLLTTLSGAPLEPAPTVDPLLEEAEALARDLGLLK